MNTLFEVTLILIASIFVFLSAVIDSSTTGSIFAVAVLCLVGYKVFFADKIANGYKKTNRVSRVKKVSKANKSSKRK